MHSGQGQATRVIDWLGVYGYTVLMFESFGWYRPFSLDLLPVDTAQWPPGGQVIDTQVVKHWGGLCSLRCCKRGACRAPS